MPITPEQLAARGQEHDHQCALFQWIAVSGSKRHPDMLMAHAVPNGAKLRGSDGEDRSLGMREGARMKAEGLRPGVPDVFVPVPREWAPGRWHHGLWVEMKRPGREKQQDGGRSLEQVAWHQKLVAQRYAVVTAYGWINAAQALARYFSDPCPPTETGDCHFYVGFESVPW